MVFQPTVVNSGTLIANGAFGQHVATYVGPQINLVSGKCRASGAKTSASNSRDAWAESTSSVALNAPHVAIATYDNGKGITLHFDNDAPVTDPTGRGSGTGAQTNWIGRDNGGTADGYTGYITDILCFTRVLPAADINNIKKHYKYKYEANW
jgi:hypothetical protein